MSTLARIKQRDLEEWQRIVTFWQQYVEVINQTSETYKRNINLLYRLFDDVDDPFEFAARLFDYDDEVTFYFSLQSTIFICMLSNKLIQNEKDVDRLNSHCVRFRYEVNFLDRSPKRYYLGTNLSFVYKITVNKFINQKLL